eukprot:CAMPEP_0174833436 /NCGR_PEP_ID=MMETSP1114-20130205/4234_1 /TAXON_ID=312471 /ORGANISM="Neobodo designis, Strain CCAP 1951/1" /LENGTH=681 /DNA_ID=CAMNT_0016067319 /DNA_START=56 /DNA_END=2101 /DNA_ORIENTATION=-
MPRGRSYSSDSSSDDDRRRRDKRDKDKKSKKDKHDKHGKKDKKDKSKDKKEKKDKKDKSRRDKRSRSPSVDSRKGGSGGFGGGLGGGLADFDIDAALSDQNNRNYLKKAMPFLARRIEMEEMAEAMPAPGEEMPLDAVPMEAPVHPLLQKPADFSGGGTSTALTLAGGGMQLIAPDQMTAKRTALATAARECRRVHVSHVPANLAPPDLRMLFERMCSRIRREMIEVEIGKPLPENAAVRIDLINDVFLNTNGVVPFAFVELSSDDMATQLINGTQVVEFPLPNGGTQRVKCRRPRDYKPMGEADDRRVQLLGLPSPEAHLETVKALFEQLGPVENFAVIPNRGFYVEFAKPEPAASAVRALHGEVLGGNVIVVQLASEAARATLLHLGLPVTGLDTDGASSSGDLRKDLMGDLLNMQLPLSHSLELFVSNFPHLKDGWPVILPTRILCLFNMLDREELTESEESYDSLTRDIEDEVERYGRVKRLIIPRSLPKPPVYPDEYVPPPKPTAETTAVPIIPAGGEASAATALTDPTGMSDATYRLELERWEAEVAAGKERYEMDVAAFKDARAEWERDCVHPVWGNQGLGRVFVEYETADEAEYAQKAIAGRLFNGRTIVTSFLFEDVLYPPPESEGGADGDDDANAGMGGEDAAADADNNGGDDVKAAEAAPEAEGGADDID